MKSIEEQLDAMTVERNGLLKVVEILRLDLRETTASLQDNRDVLFPAAIAQRDEARRQVELLAASKANTLRNENSGLVCLDHNGAVWYDGSYEELRVDGVRLGMSALIALVNPDPSKYYRSHREGDSVIVTQYTRGALMAELGLPAPQADLDKLAHGMAYESAMSIIDGNSMPMDGHLGGTWFDVDDCAEGSEEAIVEALKYLEMRGLVEHDAGNPSIVSIRNESEATA